MAINEARVHDIMTALVRPGKEKLRKVIDNYFLEESTLKHPLMAFKGKEAIYNFYRLWEIAFDDHIVIDHIAVEGDVALLRVRHKLHPRFIPLDWVQIPHIVNMKWTFVDTVRGKRIKSIEEDVSLYSLIDPIPYLGKMWGATVEPVGGFIASGLGWILDTAQPHVRDYFGWEWVDQL